MQFAAIPTVYKGVQMRSRLEARWAAVFDALGAKWEYEPFDLNGWIPDFLVHELPGVGGYHNDENRKRLGLAAKRFVSVKPSGIRNGHWRDEWDDFFNSLPYQVLVLGASPLAAWMFCRTAGWWWNAGYNFKEQCQKGLYPPCECRGKCVEFTWIPGDWKQIWKDAGNRVQWKSPAPFK